MTADQNALFLAATAFFQTLSGAELRVELRFAQVPDSDAKTVEWGVWVGLNQSARRDVDEIARRVLNADEGAVNAAQASIGKASDTLDGALASLDDIAATLNEVSKAVGYVAQAIDLLPKIPV